MAKNKVIYGGEVLIDLTADTVTADTLASGITAHDKSGEIITGTSTKDSDTSDATIAVAEMLKGKTAYARGAKLTGTMNNNGAVAGSITQKEEKYTVPIGYHDGSGTVQIATAEQAKIIANNIRKGVVILGVTGTLDEADEHPETGKSVTPTTTAQTITPSTGYTCFREITVEAIPYAEAPNSAGGITVTIG